MPIQSNLQNCHSLFFNAVAYWQSYLGLQVIYIPKLNVLNLHLAQLYVTFWTQHLVLLSLKVSKFNMTWDRFNNRIVNVQIWKWWFLEFSSSFFYCICSLWSINFSWKSHGTIIWPRTLFHYNNFLFRKTATN